jgi:carbon monoxide dehydrogenase subunit G
MSRVAVSVFVPAPIGAVWADVARVEDHVEWMADARRIDFLGDRRSGVGTRIAVETRFGPLRTTDVMEFTEWSEPVAMAVSHQGMFTGTGRFELVAEADGTRFSWTEDVRFPWYLGGPLGAAVARPVLRWVWRRNLDRFSARFSGP